VEWPTQALQSICTLSTSAVVGAVVFGVSSQAGTTSAESAMGISIAARRFRNFELFAVVRGVRSGEAGDETRNVNVPPTM
jgi:hypothetical protein